MIYYISSNDYLLSCIYLLHDVLFNYLPCCHGAGSWCKKCCTAHAFFPRKMEIHSQAVPLWLFDRGFSRKKASKSSLFWTIVLKGGCLSEIFSDVLWSGGEQNSAAWPWLWLFPSDFNSFCCLSRWGADKNSLLDEAVAFNYIHNEHSPSLIQ